MLRFLAFTFLFLFPMCLNAQETANDTNKVIILYGTYENKTDKLCDSLNILVLDYKTKDEIGSFILTKEGKFAIEIPQARKYFFYYGPMCETDMFAAVIEFDTSENVVWHYQELYFYIEENTDAFMVENTLEVKHKMKKKEKWLMKNGILAKP